MAKNIAKVGSFVEYQSLTKELEVIPSRYNIMGDLGVFEAEFLNTDQFTIPRISYKEYKLDPMAWGTAAKNVGSNGKGYLPLVIPHRGLEDAILPRDIRNKFQWEDVIATERKESVQTMFNRKMKTMKDVFAKTWSDAMMQLVREGTANIEGGGTVNFYTEFGVTRTDVALALATAGTNPKILIQTIIDDIVNNFEGGYTPSRYVGIADPVFFDKLANHPYVLDAVKYFQQDQSVELLTKKLGTNGYNLDTVYQVLDFGGITWIRAAAGEMTAGEARVFPVDVPDLFKIFFAPSEENFDVVNQTAEQLYYFEYIGDRNNNIEMKMESNFLPATMWPKSIVRVTTN